MIYALRTGVRCFYSIKSRVVRTKGERNMSVYQLGQQGFSTKTNFEEKLLPNRFPTKKLLKVLVEVIWTWAQVMFTLCWQQLAPALAEVRAALVWRRDQTRFVLDFARDLSLHTKLPIGCSRRERKLSFHHVLIKLGFPTSDFRPLVGKKQNFGAKWV